MLDAGVQLLGIPSRGHNERGNTPSINQQRIWILTDLVTMPLPRTRARGNEEGPKELGFVEQVAADIGWRTSSEPVASWSGDRQLVDCCHTWSPPEVGRLTG